MLNVAKLIKHLGLLDPDAFVLDMDLSIEIDPEAQFVQRWYYDIDDEDDGDDDPERASAEPDKAPKPLKLKVV
jgi:hypothetical protein